MRIKFSRWQTLFVVLSVIYLITIIFVTWDKWQSSDLPDPRDVIPAKGDIFDQISPRQPRDLLEGQREPIDLLAAKRQPVDLLADIEPIKEPSIFQRGYEKAKKALRIERLRIIGIAFMTWVIPSAIVYLLGFSISKSKRFFKDIRVGIILILVGIFIPTVFYPLVEPAGWAIRRHEIQIFKGKEIHYKLYELGLTLGRIKIPYSIFVASGIVLVFIGTGICVLNKYKKTTTTKNDNSIVTGNNSN